MYSASAELSLRQNWCRLRGRLPGILADLGHKTSADALNEALFQIDALDGQARALLMEAPPEEAMAFFMGLFSNGR